MRALFSGYRSPLPERQSSQSVKPINCDLSNDEISKAFSFLPVACTWYTEPEITLSEHLRKYLYSCSESYFRLMLRPSQSRVHPTGGGWRAAGLQSPKWKFKEHRFCRHSDITCFT